jgi:hypothetical protein
VAGFWEWDSEREAGFGWGDVGNGTGVLDRRAGVGVLRWGQARSKQSDHVSFFSGPRAAVSPVYEVLCDLRQVLVLAPKPLGQF